MAASEWRRSFGRQRWLFEPPPTTEPIGSRFHNPLLLTTREARPPGLPVLAKRSNSADFDTDIAGADVVGVDSLLVGGLLGSLPAAMTDGIGMPSWSIRYSHHVKVALGHADEAQTLQASAIDNIF